MSLTAFSSVRAACRRDHGIAEAELTADWLQGRTAYGGWQAALAVMAMRDVIDGELPLRSLQVNFIAPVPPGPVVARAERLRQGKSAAQVEARILVGDAVALVAIGIFGQARSSQIVQAPRARTTRAVDELTDLPHIDGVIPAFQRHFQMRWAEGRHPYSGAAESDARIYVRFRDQGVHDLIDLVCLADAIPPSAIALFTSPAPISSMNWTLELVRPLTADDAAGWWRFDATLTAAGGGYAWENVEIWSPRGDLTALSRQCVALFA